LLRPATRVNGRALGKTQLVVVKDLHDFAPDGKNISDSAAADETGCNNRRRERQQHIPDEIILPSFCRKIKRTEKTTRKQ